MPERATLEVVSGPVSGSSFALDPARTTSIGRKRGDILIEDPLISGKHCTIRFADNGWWVADLGSTNGTFVDGKQVRKSQLHPGTQLTIGNCKIVFSLSEDGQHELAGVEQEESARLEISWLLDEELVEMHGTSDRTRPAEDVIGQDLRLPPGLSAVVEIVAGEDAGKVFRFTRGNVTMGRKQGEIPLSDVEVSRRHAVIEIFGRDMIFLRDLGSTNGTYHNGRKVSVSRLQSGDTVGCGKTVMKIQVSR